MLLKKNENHIIIIILHWKKECIKFVFNTSVVADYT